MKAYMREPINGLTHLGGAVFAFVGLLALVIKASLERGASLAIVAAIIFGVSMMALYAVSATYHMVLASDRAIAIWRRLDHSMIYLLIAGSYAPFCLVSLNGPTGWVLFSIVMLIAVSGITFKLVWFNSPRWLSTTLYIGMGWIMVFAITPLAQVLSPLGIGLLFLGGIFYTIGGIIYGLKPRVLSFKHLGFHEIFHIFVLLGSLAHFLCVYFFVL
ncbi:MULTISPECIES: hemolysin III family protein [Exiguobacterium]|uniref:PAQR family membrane homeostasis protein TrhA n=1 Tax=Exiguobacterium TaxID=33986 RepID=UPI0006AA54D7|nr:MULTISPECIES: hemolysin III family protein [Exiguobacterium]KOP28862.1 hemolysin [Exiguobacterium sp. BMC-KP]MDQ6466323.1 hemolysin III family protein [Exiguobacterium acetylicum]MDT0171824.1 hemolysin III family protein [Exiguobacterium sp. BRG2]HAL01250.1 hemolysin [Exiguobacterium sp.]HBF58557.1 hemolysin [Exiguobacterium sp.]